jgi:DNA gyrase subunit B
VERELEEAIGLLAVPEAGTALDVACRDGDVLARIKRRHACTTMGIEPSPELAALAHERVDVVHRGTLAEIAPMEGTWDVVVCVGAPEAFGTWPDAFAGLRRLARPGGRALVGLPEDDASVDLARAAGWEIEDDRGAGDLVLLTLRAV